MAAPSKPRSPLTWITGFWLACLLAAGQALAAESWPTRGTLHFRQAAITHENDQLLLDMRLDVRLSQAMVDALKHAIPLYFLTEIRLEGESDFPMHRRQKAYHRIAVMLSWEHLQRRWQLINLRNGHVLLTDTLQDALNTLGAFHRFPLIDSRELLVGIPYLVKVRFRLDSWRLPPPLWLKTWLDPAWRLDSGWKTFYVNEDLLW